MLGVGHHVGAYLAPAEVDTDQGVHIILRASPRDALKTKGFSTGLRFPLRGP